METARAFAPETRSRDRLWFGFRSDKPGKRPGFTDSTGEYRDTRTGWLRSQSRANPSLALIPCLSGKIQGILRFRPRIHYPMGHKTPTILRRPWENSLLGGTGNFSCLTGTQIRPTAKFGRRIREEAVLLWHLPELVSTISFVSWLRSSMCLLERVGLAYDLGTLEHLKQQTIRIFLLTPNTRR